MKHAYCIIAHNEPQVLKALLQMLDDARNDIFLHIDRKAESLRHEMEGYKPEASRLFVVEQPVAVFWGHLSQVEAEYRVFEAALEHGPYQYYHLLSGVDLPIKSQDYIHDFFARHAGKEFVAFWDTPAHRRDLKRKVGRYYLFTRYFKDKSHPLHGVTSLLRNLFLVLQKMTQYHRLADYDFRKGFNWVSITHPFCLYLVGQKEDILRRFRRTLCPDEIFLQTVLWNSPFKKNIYDLSNPERGSMRKIDWQRGNPHTWQEEDFRELLSSEELFARKFSEGYIFRLPQKHEQK